MTYGILISISILLCILLGSRLAKKANLNVEIIWALAFWTIIGGVLGARVYHVVTDLPYYIQDPIKVFFIWNGGLGIFGAIAGGLLASVTFLHSKKQPLRPWLNILGVITPLGQSIGRWGNYFNNELWGKVSPIAGLAPTCSPFRPFEASFCAIRHPMFLYESISTFLLFLLLIYLHVKKSFKHISSFYIMGYSIIRFFMEFFKDNTAFLNGTQILCLMIFTVTTIKLFVDTCLHKN